MRSLCLTAVLLLAAGPGAAADPTPPSPKDRARVALALAGGCSCPAGGPARCDRVAHALAKSAAPECPTVAPAPREKKCTGCEGKCSDCPACECPRPAQPVSPDALKVPTPMPKAADLPPALIDQNGCRWEPRIAADGSVVRWPDGSPVYDRVSCPLRR